MPYILQARRDDLKAVVASIESIRIDNPGELNYLISILFKIYLKQHGINYRIFNEIIGAGECAKMELYRRLLAKLEDAKIIDNGDIYNE